MQLVDVDPPPQQRHGEPLVPLCSTSQFSEQHSENCVQSIDPGVETRGWTVRFRGLGVGIRNHRLLLVSALGQDTQTTTREMDTRFTDWVTCLQSVDFHTYPNLSTESACRDVSSEWPPNAFDWLSMSNSVDGSLRPSIHHCTRCAHVMSFYNFSQLLVCF